MRWPTDRFTLHLRYLPVNGIFSLRLQCEDCGGAYLLQVGQLWQLNLRSPLERQVIEAEALHRLVCAKNVPTPGGSGRNLTAPDGSMGPVLDPAVLAKARSDILGT